MKSAFHLLRYVDHDSIVHRVNARTKVLGITAMALCLAVRPGWITLGAIWSLGVITFVAARLSFGTIPRFPKIVTYGVILSLGLALINGGDPLINVGPVSFEAGGLLLQTRFTLVTFGLLFLSLLLGWTTSPAQLPSAVHFILRPFKVLRVPVDDVVAGLSLAIRVMPLLMDELTTTFTLWRSRQEAARKFKESESEASSEPPSKKRQDPIERIMNDVVNVAATSTTSAVRRSSEVGLAMRAKGSTRAAVTSSPWGYPDFLAAAMVTFAVCVIFYFDR